MKLFSSIFVFAVAMLFSANSAFAQSLTGTWWNQEKSAHIEIYENNGVFFGKIVWLKEPNDEAGKPKTDPLNPVAKLRTRSRLGMVVLAGLKADGKDFWSGGTIYDPKSGKTYSLQATLNKTGVLDLRGFLGISLIGKTQTWTRVK